MRSACRELRRLRGLIRGLPRSNPNSLIAIEPACLPPIHGKGGGGLVAGPVCEGVVVGSVCDGVVIGSVRGPLCSNPNSLIATEPPRLPLTRGMGGDEVAEEDLTRFELLVIHAQRLNTQGRSNLGLWRQCSHCPLPDSTDARQRFWWWPDDTIPVFAQPFLGPIRHRRVFRPSSSLIGLR